jgi:group I intron endonuclease
MNNCGIYQIKNLITGQLYIGHSIRLKKRKNEHFNDLEKNKHGNIHLQRSYNKYGKENFIFEIILYCEKFELIRYEQILVNKIGNYNINKECVTSRKGVKASKKTKVKISIATTGKNNPFYGKHHSKEKREKISIRAKKQEHSSESREKVSNKLKGIIRSLDSIKKSSENRIGQKRSEESKRKMSESHMGQSGEKAPNSKLKNEQVLKIRELYNTNDYTYEELGIMFNVCDKTICDIIKRKTWKNI